MSITSVLIILFYSLQPYWWILAIVVAIPLLCLTIHSYTFYVPDRTSVVIGFISGLAAAAAVPYLTGSSFEHVATLADWGALAAVTLAVTFYIWLNLHILSRD